ncbi:MAG: glycoside hydrolase, partial [Phycisphaerae bacterium]|nr:glycoside hydrolase [Phycisphaerae bacterium]
GPIPAFGGDKQWFVVDTCADRVVTNVYAAWRVYAGCCAGATFTRSLDGGATFTPPIEIAGMPNFGTLAIGPDRELYVCGVGFFDYGDFMVARTNHAFDPATTPEFVQRSSADLGGSLVVGAAVNPAGLLGQVWIGVDTSSGPNRGNVYLLASTHDASSVDPMDVQLARSRDGGVTWQPPVRVNDDPPAAHAWQWFGTMSVAPDGRLDVIWNDTRDDTAALRSTVYYTSSSDGGRTFAANRAITLPFEHGVGYPQQSKLGDYYHMVSDRVGAHLAFAATFNGEQDVYYLRIGDYDCNDNGLGDAAEIEAGDAADCDGDGVPDACQIAAGTLPDSDGNGVPDECELPADLDGSGAVDWFDLLLLLGRWGLCPPTPITCLGDVDGDGVVGFLDLLTLLESWSDVP